MNDTHWLLIFNAADSSYKAWFFPFFLCLDSVIACVIFVLFKMKLLPKVNVRVGIMVAFFFALSLLTSYFTTRHYLTYRDALASGHTSFVEGTITDLTTLQKQESFSVNGVRFSYSDYVITEGFNNMSSHGGPIRAGQYVRIWYIDNVIIKLEERT